MAGPDIQLFEMHAPEQAQPIRASDFGVTHFASHTDAIDALVSRALNGPEAPTAPRAVP